MDDKTDLITLMVEQFAPDIVKDEVKYTGETKEVSAKEASKIEERWLENRPRHIGEGGRFFAMRAYGGLLRALGDDETDIRLKLTKFAEKRFDPKKSDAEIKEYLGKILPWVKTLKPGMPVPVVVEKKGEPSPEKMASPNTGGRSEDTRNLTGSTLIAANVDKDTDVLQIFMDAFHVNSAALDPEIAKLLLLCFMGTCEYTGDGLHFKPSAGTGEGKSHITNAAIHAFPEGCVLKGAFTDRALLYDRDMKPGTIVKLDEAQGKSEAFESVLKEAISCYQDGIKYRTVDGQQTTQTIQLPQRITFIVLSVDHFGDEQTKSRFIPLHLANVPRRNEIISEFRLGKRDRGEAKLHVNETVMKCRAVLQHFKNNKFKVQIPFWKNIQYIVNDPRVQEWFESCVMYNAVLNYKNREHTIESDGFIVIKASRKDFDEIQSMTLFKHSAVLEYRLGADEIKLIEQIKAKELEGKTVTRTELLKISGVGDGRLSQILNGREDRKKNGLRSTFAIEEITITDGEFADKDEKYPSTRRSRKAYVLPHFPDLGLLMKGGHAETNIVRWVEQPA